MLTVKLAHHIYLTGQRRSGNHAIQLWVLGMCPPPAIKLNFCPCIQAKKRAEFLEAYRGPETSLIQGGEDMMKIGVPEELILVPRSHRRIVILRNPINLFRFGPEKADVVDESIDKFLRAWVLYANEFTGRTSVVPQKVPICFDRWFVSEEYRRERADALGLAFSDRNLNKLDPDWGHSTYDEFQFQGRAQEMQVLDRWRRFQHTRRFKYFVCRLKDWSEAWSLFLELFEGLPPELEASA